MDKQAIIKAREALDKMDHYAQREPDAEDDFEGQDYIDSTFPFGFLDTIKALLDAAIAEEKK